MPKTAKPPHQKARELQREFPIFHVADGYKLICTACEKRVSYDLRSHVTQHLAGQEHKKNAEKQKSSPAQTFLASRPKENRKFSQFAIDLCEAFTNADIPLYKLENEKLRKFLFTYTKQTIPDRSTISKSYIDKVYAEKLGLLQQKLLNEKLWISIDETTDIKDRYVANLIIGVLGKTGEVYLAATSFLEATNNITIFQFLISSLNGIFPNGIPYDNFLVFVSDAAAYMKKSYENGMKTLFPKMIHVTCLCHALHNVADGARKELTVADKFISCSKKFFRKSPKNLADYKNFAPDLPLPPRPVITRWGTWIQTGFFYVEHLEVIAEMVTNLPAKSEALTTLQQILESNRPKLETELACLTANYRELVEALKKLQKTMLVSEVIEVIERVSVNLQHEVGKKKLLSVL